MTVQNYPNRGSVPVRPMYTADPALLGIGVLPGRQGPYGGSSSHEADIARILGVAVPVDATGQDHLPEVEELRFQVLHGEMLLVVQACIQHAAVQPGLYDLPRDGWRSPIRPRCMAMPAAQATACQAFCAATPVPDSQRPDRRTLLDHAVRHFAAKAALFAA